MKKIFVFLNVVLCLIVCISLTGCSISRNEPVNSSESEKEEMLEVSQVQRLSMGTAGSGGAYYVMGSAMANLINKKLDGIEMDAEVTDGSIQNINFIQNGDMDIGWGGIQTAMAAYEGKAPFDSKMDIRAMALVGPGVVHAIASKASGIKVMEDLRGKRVSLGAPGAAGRGNYEIVLNAYGISIDDIKVYDLSYAEAVNAIKDGNLDVVWTQSGIPTSAVLDLANSEDVVFIPISDEVRDKVCSEYSHLIKSVIPKESYTNTEDIPSLAVPNVMFCATDIDEETIYQVTKCIFENIEELKKSHEAFTLVDAKSAPTSAIPMHPGAERYFKEIGVM